MFAFLNFFFFYACDVLQRIFIVVCSHLLACTLNIMLYQFGGQPGLLQLQHHKVVGVFCGDFYFYFIFIFFGFVVVESSDGERYWCCRWSQLNAHY